MSEEVVYYEDDTVTITNTRAILGAKTFSMANITSVSTGIKPKNTFPAIVVAGVGFLFTSCFGCLLLNAISAVFEGRRGATFQTSPIGGMIVTGIPTIIGILIIVGGIVLFLRAKPKYVVQIGTAGGEINALMSKDEAYIHTVVEAMNKAIINRG